ncbi:hypothetical protein DFJ58DRAFT_153737 [Suillus subalutaceus]|uniref:uncharacterized protein n=1 Tax=Suillus subalutaceus TaxID=48586 RepID=UPI001B867E44|nr:uncharacterized protein DFJ58DRAFT_153737 [Suillus subalutaceus]KAG1865870.1 hypothetical protein DFJ58DRAFT_153737 [Suillus subalutaceus]
MSETFVRNLNFQTHDLGREVTLLLTFDGNMKGLYKNVCPIVWKTCTFGKEGPYSMRATYTSQLAFFKAQVDEGTITDAATCVNINEGEITTLTQDDEEVFHFSDPVAGEKGLLQAKNETGYVQDIGIGFMCPGELMPTPALYFNDVGDGSNAVAKFIPKLRAYITSDYGQTAILQRAIDSHCIWEQDLSYLDSENTTWKLTYDEYYGHRVTRG